MGTFFLSFFLSSLRDRPRFFGLSLAPQWRRLFQPDCALLLSDIADSGASRQPVCVPPPGLPPQARRGALSPSSKRPAWRPGRTTAAFGDPAPRGSLPRTGQICRYRRRALSLTIAARQATPVGLRSVFQWASCFGCPAAQLAFQSAWLGLRHRPTIGFSGAASAA
jgi:hypothetical protein